MNNYMTLSIILFVIFMINRNMTEGMTLEKTTDMVKNMEGDINTLPSIPAKIKETLVKINDLSPIKIKGLSGNKDPISIIRNNPVQVVDNSNIRQNKDFISPNPEDSTEYRFIDENMKTAWSNVDVSQHPKYYTSDMQDEKINVAGFFNNDQFFHDNTSPNSNTVLPERCKKTETNGVVCDYNNRLQLIPPKLITDSENNQVLNSIGGNTVYQSVESTKIDDVSGNNYQVWEYDNEKSINGGKYFENVYGSSESNETYMEIGSIKPNYSF